MTECGFCHGEPVTDATQWLDGKRRPPLPCPRCGRDRTRREHGDSPDLQPTGADFTEPLAERQGVRDSQSNTALGDVVGSPLSDDQGALDHQKRSVVANSSPGTNDAPSPNPGASPADLIPDDQVRSETHASSVVGNHSSALGSLPPDQPASGAQAQAVRGDPCQPLSPEANVRPAIRVESPSEFTPVAPLTPGLNGRGDGSTTNRPGAVAAARGTTPRGESQCPPTVPGSSS